MAIKLDLINEAEVLEAIRKRPELARQVLNEAVEAAAKVIQERMIPKAPGPGIEMDNTGEAVWEVGPEKAKFYYGFFETGTAAHLVLPREAQALKIGEEYAASAHPGGIPARPFMRPAVDEGKDAAGEAAGEVIKKAIE